MMTRCISGSPRKDVGLDQSLRQTPVAVIEEAGSIQENLKKNYSQWQQFLKQKPPRSDDHRKENFQGVESNPGCCIEIEIRVMYHNGGAKRWGTHECGVLQINYKIKKQYADNYGQPIRQSALIQESLHCLHSRKRYKLP